MTAKPDPAHPAPSASGYGLRESRPGDLEALWRIDQQCFAPGISYSRRELADYMGRPRAFTLVAEEEGEGVGFLVGDRNRRNQGHIITIDVLPGARRKGLGSVLLSAAEARLRSAGCEVVYLETAVDNAAAIRFYKRHGYSVIRTIPGYYLGNVDALVMAKEL